MTTIRDLPRPVAFVLSGGSNLGAVQVGMLRGLRRAGIEPDLIVGSSVGAMNGAMIAADPEHGADRLTDIWLSLRRRDVFPSRLPMQVARLVWTRTHLQSPSGLRGLLDDHLDAPTFEDLVLPFGVVATDVDHGEPVVITHGSVTDAIVASTAIPAVFPIVEREGRRLFDGGVSANLPVHQAVAMGAGSLVVLDAGAPTARPSEARSVPLDRGPGHLPAAASPAPSRPGQGECRRADPRVADADPHVGERVRLPPDPRSSCSRPRDRPSDNSTSWA